MTAAQAVPKLLSLLTNARTSSAVSEARTLTGWSFMLGMRGVGAMADRKRVFPNVEGQLRLRAYVSELLRHVARWRRLLHIILMLL